MLPQMQAEPPTIVIATLQSLCHMLEKQIFGLGALQVLVIDEVSWSSFILKVLLLSLGRLVPCKVNDVLTV